MNDGWKALFKCWSLVYLGPPDCLQVDQGSNFVSEEFKASAKAGGIEVPEAPVESPETISHVERYHAALRAAYLKMEATLKTSRPPEILQLAVQKDCALHVLYSGIRSNTEARRTWNGNDTTGEGSRC